MNILLVDDEKPALEKLTELIDWSIFTQNGQLLTAQSAEQALRIMKEVRVGLLLTDVRMPDMSGMNLARLSVEISPQTVVLFISAYHDFEYARAGLQYGVRDYLLKPVEPQTLCEVLNRILTLKKPDGNDKQSTIISETVNQKLIEKAKQYIERNLRQRFTLKEVAKTLYVSPQHLCRIFKKETGIHFVAYVQGLRIQAAKEKLIQSVRDISVQLGFGDYTYLCKAFKAHEGISPLQYRAIAMNSAKKDV